MEKTMRMLDERDRRNKIFCETFADTPLQDIANYYGDDTARRVQSYFKEHPSPRFVWIQTGCKGPEPGGDICQH
jgi:hypothetical protein